MPKQTPQAAMQFAAPPLVAPDELPDLRYEEAVAELEQLVQGMESSQLPLDRLLENYRRGSQLLGVCRTRLEAIEQQVKILDNEQLKSWESDT